MSGTRVLGTKFTLVAGGAGLTVLPRTGLDVVWWVGVALAAIIVGLLFVRSARYTAAR